MMSANSDSLVQVHAIFRHGHRTPIKEHLYPKSEHLNEDYYPYGHGQLTQEGKKAMYELGELLRERYNDFLGDTYIPHKVDAVATATDRTQMSIQLVLAGLFPPRGNQILKENLNWQPIPYKCAPFEQDKIFAVPVHKEFVKVYMDNYRKTPMEEHDEFFAYFEEHTGLKNVTPRQVWATAGTLITEIEWGFAIPQWVLPIYKKIKEIVLLEYRLQTATNELKRLAVGGIFTKILKDIKSKIGNESKCDVHLYSGHDYNVAHVLTVLGLMYPHLPSYAACILLEVHRRDEGYSIKVIYRQDNNSEFKTMNFPNGNDSLSLEEFDKIVAEFNQLPGHL